MREALKLFIAVVALVFVGVTVANSSAFGDLPDTQRAVATSTVTVTTSSAAPMVEPQAFALGLAAIACVGFMASRRNRRR